MYLVQYKSCCSFQYLYTLYSTQSIRDVGLEITLICSNHDVFMKINPFKIGLMRQNSAKQWGIGYRWKLCVFLVFPSLHLGFHIWYCWRLNGEGKNGVVGKQVYKHSGLLLLFFYVSHGNIHKISANGFC